MSGHTPGPWRLHEPDIDGFWIIEASDGMPVVGLTLIRAPYKANARLIAAAPDLLECLRMFVKADDMTGWDFGVWQHHAETVIAKAEGLNP